MYTRMLFAWLIILCASAGCEKSDMVMQDSFDKEQQPSEDFINTIKMLDAYALRNDDGTMTISNDVSALSAEDLLMLHRGIEIHNTMIAEGNSLSPNLQVVGAVCLLVAPNALNVLQAVDEVIHCLYYYHDYV